MGLQTATPESKKCSRCGKLKPLDEFQKDRTHSDGRKSSCKECMAKSGNPVRSFCMKDGTRVYDDIRRIINGEPITPEIIMKAHGLKSEEWDVVSFCTNVWQQQTDGGGTVDLCQSKLTVRQKTEIEITFDDVDEYFKTADFSSKEPMKPFEYSDSEEVLEICYVDPHIGLLSWREETGNDYDLNIAENRYKECIADTISRCSSRKFKKVIFATLGDILHIDNDNQTTTKGTFQQAEGRTPKIFGKAANILVGTLDELLTLKTPIEYVYLCGNHDRVTGYMLAYSVKSAFRFNENINFDISPLPQKAKKIGISLIGFMHGDAMKKNADEWILKDFRKEYGESRFVEIHCGHKHEFSVVKAPGGILLKTLPPICEASYWENQQGYRSDRGIMCFVWNEKTGLRETWYYYI